MDGGHPPPAAGLPMDGGRACIECRRSMTTTHLRKAASPWMEVTRRPPPASPWMEVARASNVVGL